MQRIITMTLMLVGGLLVVLAQPKDEQVKRIRQLYAEAKQKIAQNGKNGKAPLDLTIVRENGEEVDPDFILDSHTELTFYFDKGKTKADQEFYDQSNCYFINEYWTSHGHESFLEVLVDAKGYPLFIFSKGITDGGYVQENRYYYNQQGQTIHGIFKSGMYDQPLSERDDEQLTPTIGDEKLEEAKHLLKVFQSVMHTSNHVPASTAKATTPKAERIKAIRAAYAKAQEKIAADKTSENPHHIFITLHEALSEQFPPVTVTYQHNKEEGENYEWRYYYDENGKCIEAKTNGIEEGDGVAERQTFFNYLNTAKLLVGNYPLHLFQFLKYNCRPGNIHIDNQLEQPVNSVVDDRNEDTHYAEANHFANLFLRQFHCLFLNASNSSTISSKSSVRESCRFLYLPNLTSSCKKG